MGLLVGLPAARRARGFLPAGGVRRSVLVLSLLFLGATPSARAGDETAVETEPKPTYPALHLIGFADANVFATDEPVVRPRSGFFEGQFVLHFASALSSRVSFFGEVSLTARRDAAQSAAAPGFNAEVERSILKWVHRDWLKLSVGRYHTPINYWNVAFHHGQWLQTTISRPEMIQFGGQFQPVHFVGVLAEGSVPAGSWGIDYNLGAGNGRASVISRAGDAGDVNDGRALVVGVAVKPARPFGLQAGGAIYRDLISQGGKDHREWIASGHVAWTKETPEVIAEYARVRHRSLATDRVSRHSAYYAQLAYRLGAGGRRWKPYFRWEEIRIDAADEVFSALRDRRGFLLGLRHDASDLVALKAEYRRQRTDSERYVNGAFVQLSCTF